MPSQKKFEMNKVLGPGVEPPDPRTVGPCASTVRRYCGAIPATAELPGRVPIPELSLPTGQVLRWEAIADDGSMFTQLRFVDGSWTQEAAVSRDGAIDAANKWLLEGGCSPFKDAEELIDHSFPLFIQFRAMHGCSPLHTDGSWRVPSVLALECHGHADNSVTVVYHECFIVHGACRRRVIYDKKLTPPFTASSIKGLATDELCQRQSWLRYLVENAAGAAEAIQRRFPWVMSQPE